MNQASLNVMSFFTQWSIVWRDKECQYGGHMLNMYISLLPNFTLKCHLFNMCNVVQNKKIYLC